MFKYKVTVKKGKNALNQSSKSVKKSIIIKSKTQKSEKKLFSEAAKYYKEKYNFILESANISSNETINVYVGTWGKYNDGSIDGEWVDLSDFNTPEEFKEYCYGQLHADEEDAELMFQDVEGPSWVHEVINDYGMNYEFVWGWLALDEYDKHIADGYIEIYGISGFDDIDDLMSHANDAYMGGYGQDFDDWLYDTYEEFNGHVPVRDFMDKNYNDIDWDRVKETIMNDQWTSQEEEDWQYENEDQIEDYQMEMVIEGFGDVSDLISAGYIDWNYVSRNWKMELSVASNGCVFHD